MLANLLVEGGVDAAVFHHFLHETLKHLRARPGHELRPAVLVLDNASIHQHVDVVNLATHYHVFVLFTAQYSPWLNPVEGYFWKVKQQLKRRDTAMR